MVGILIRTRIGMDVYGTNTRIEQKELGDFQAGDELEIDFQLACWLTPQQYTLTVATQDSDGSSHDWLDDAIAFDVVDTRVAAGVANLRAENRMARLTVKVHPRARRVGNHRPSGDAWKLALAAPPVDGKANDECVRFFAELAGRAAIARAHRDGLDKPHQGCGD